MAPSTGTQSVQMLRLATDGTSQSGEESTTMSYSPMKMKCVFEEDAEEGMKNLQPSARAQMELANSQADKTIIIPVRWTMDISKVPSDRLAPDSRPVKRPLKSGNQRAKEGECVILRFYSVSASRGQVYEGADLETILKRGVPDMPRLRGEVYSALPFRGGGYQTQVIEAMADLARSEYQLYEATVREQQDQAEAERVATESLLSLFTSVPAIQEGSAPGQNASSM
jgi:hypothetical protein